MQGKTNIDVINHLSGSKNPVPDKTKNMVRNIPSVTIVDPRNMQQPIKNSAVNIKIIDPKIPMNPHLKNTANTIKNMEKKSIKAINNTYTRVSGHPPMKNLSTAEIIKIS